MGLLEQVPGDGAGGVEVSRFFYKRPLVVTDAARFTPSGIFFGQLRSAIIFNMTIPPAFIPAFDAAKTAEETVKGRLRQANEALILAAAERVFAGAGFGGATMAAIAEASGLPKANLHYYFGSQQALYRRVLARTLDDWLVPTHGITPQADPRTALAHYIRAKMALSAERPHASRVFANELLHGAPVLGELLATELGAMVRDKAAVIQGWINAGRMAPQAHARATEHVVALIFRGCGLP